MASATVGKSALHSARATYGGGRHTFSLISAHLSGRPSPPSLAASPGAAGAAPSPAGFASSLAVPAAAAAGERAGSLDALHAPRAAAHKANGMSFFIATGYHAACIARPG